jgi:hypothetical protein
LVFVLKIVFSKNGNHFSRFSIHFSSDYGYYGLIIPSLSLSVV